MCGIAGIVDFSGAPIEEARLRRARDDMRHRGPDDEGIWTHVGSRASAGLAAVRLAVIDPTPGGHQPMVSPDGRYALVFNGEIYNYRHVRRALNDLGVVFLSDSDTEVVLHSLIHWGTSALNRLEGMWALGFYDHGEGSGLLARDPIGIKPLFWAFHHRRLCFASELTTLRILDDDAREISGDALLHYVRYGFIAHPATVFEGVHNLPPGTFLTFGENRVGEPERYYRPPDEEPGPLEYGQLCRRVREAIGVSVASQRLADVPVGAFLSGGLDSSIVVYHLAECSGRPVPTFTVGFDDHRLYDERPYARAMAERFGTEHHELLVSHDEVLAGMEGLLNRLGQPFGDSSLIPTAVISRYARERVTVALSGDGGDELFGGYWRYLGHESLAAYQRWPGWLRRRWIEPVLSGMSSSKSTVLGNRVRQIRKLLRGTDGNPVLRHAAWSRILAPEAEAILFTSGFSKSALGLKNDGFTYSLDSIMAARNGRDPMNAILAFDLQYGLPADMLHKVDLASMAHSLEVRVPLLDLTVVNRVLPLPSRYKVWRGLRKRLLIDAYRGRLPDVVLDRPKMGFEVPLGEYLRGPLREMFHDTVTRSIVESFGILDYDAVMGVYRDHADRRAEHGDLLYSLLVMCWWRRRCATAL